MNEKKETVNTSDLESFIKNDPKLAKTYEELKSKNIGLNDFVNSDPQLKTALAYLNNNNISLNDVITFDDDEEDSDNDTVENISVETKTNNISFDDIDEEDEDMKELDDLF